MKKRLIWGALSAVMVTAFTAGCSGRQEKNIVFNYAQKEEQPQTNLSFFGYKYEALNVMAIEDALHGFMDEYPDISITYDGIKGVEYYDVLDKRIATGNGDDIIMVDHERVLELGEQGKLADLSGISTLGNFSDLALSQIDAGGEVYYLPTSISAFGLYCNLDLLKEHGREIPENMEEFEAVCDYFVSQDIIPIIANNDISLKTAAIAKAMFPFYQKGDVTEDLERFNSGEADLAEAFRPGFELVEQMLEHGWINREEALNTAKTKDDLVQFAKGENPFMLTGAWAVTRVRDLSPEFEFEVTPYPFMEDGSALVINIDTRVSVNADSPHQEEAKKFVEYLTRSDVMWEFVDSQSSFSPLAENRLAEDEAIQSIGPYLTNGRSVIGADDNLNFPIWEISRQCVVGMLEGDDADSAVLRMRKQMDEWVNSRQEDGT